MLSGNLTGSLLVSADGSHALVTTNPIEWLTGADHTQVAVINTTTGTQTGNTLYFDGYPADAFVFGVDGSQALITIGENTGSTRLAVIDTETGTQTGTFTLTGHPWDQRLLSADGTRALITTAISNSLEDYSTTVTVLSIAQ